MAKFDVYPAPDGSYWLDCQADILASLNSRLVVPLRSPDDHGGGDPRLNPTFTVEGREFVMMTHFAAAVPRSALSRSVSSLADREYEIGIALDRLIGGY